MSVSAALVAVLVLAASPARAEKWTSVPHEDLEARPLVDRQADAEALFWDVKVVDSFTGKSLVTEVSHHVRIKVFTERGRQTQGQVDIPSGWDQRIEGISARTISPSGQIAEVPPAEIHERVMIKGNRSRLRVKTFVFRNVEVGSIVEYRWRELRGPDYPRRGLFELQRDIPTQRITYHIKPVEIRGWSAPLQCQSYGAAPTQLQREEFGYYTTTLSRIPAYLEEPCMPPEREARNWMVLYYAAGSISDPFLRWRTVAEGLGREDDDIRAMARDVKRAATEIVGDAREPEERLRRLYDFCTTRIVNLESRAAGLSDDQRARLRPNAHPVRTLEERQGVGRDIEVLFAALARAAGFDARLARVGDRGFCFFSRGMLPGFLSELVVVVRLGDQWRFFDPRIPHAKFGTLRWQQEDMEALVHEQGEPLWLKTPLTPASGSGVERTGSFRLLADGTLEGEVRHGYHGHLDAEHRQAIESTSEEEQAQAFRDEVGRHTPSAEITDVRFEHAARPDSDLILRYRIRIPGYAMVTGRRLLFRTAVLQSGQGPRFETSARKNPVDFHYPSFEDDSIAIELPSGYDVESADPPPDLDVPGVLRYHATVDTTAGGRQVACRRRLWLERHYFDVRAYGSLRQMFEAVHERDQHTLALRERGAGDR